MKIIRKEPNPSGAYSSIQSWEDSEIPDGYAVWPDELDTVDFYAHKGFVTLTVADDEVTDYSVNTELYNQWEADHPARNPSEDEPTEEDDTAAMLVDHEYRLTLLELGLTE